MLANNKVDSVKDSNKLIKIFIKPKTRKLSKTKKLSQS